MEKRGFISVKGMLFPFLLTLPGLLRAAIRAAISLYQVNLFHY
jgi:prepilin signal peptidase PulO-like enzyme (type II secretory pathway)